MAILKTVQTAFGLEVVDAHHRVENVALVAKKKKQNDVPDQEPRQCRARICFR